MISPFLPVQAADTVALDFGVFIAEQARTHRVSQTAIIAALRPLLDRKPADGVGTADVTTSEPSVSGPESALDRVLITTPSQPEAPSKPHAPAAQTDGEASPQAAPSVTSIPESSGAEAHGERNAAEQSAAVEGVSLTTDSPANEGGEDVAPPDSTQNETLMPRADAAELAFGSAVEAGALPSKRQTKRQQVIDCHKANPDWNSFQIAEYLGFGAAHVQVIAGQCGIKLPPAPRPEQPNMRDKVIAVAEANPGLTTRQIAEAAGCSLGTAARWAKEAREKALPAEELPPLSKPSERLRPLVENDVSDVLHRPRKAPSGRFYLRDKVTGHFVHQSLQPAPHGDGPMMTMDRKWAWYDTLDRYRGAKKRWPQIAEMRKEAVSK